MHCVCVCRCSVPEGRGSLVISPQRRREGGSGELHARTSQPLATRASVGHAASWRRAVAKSEARKRKREQGSEARSALALPLSVPAIPMRGELLLVVAWPAVAALVPAAAGAAGGAVGGADARNERWRQLSSMNEVEYNLDRRLQETSASLGSFGSQPLGSLVSFFPSYALLPPVSSPAPPLPPPPPPPSPPPLPPTEAIGCKDKLASNYQSRATIDDRRLCRYDRIGCTDPTAGNYVPGANIDDGSCKPTILGCMVRDSAYSIPSRPPPAPPLLLSSSMLCPIVSLREALRSAHGR